MARTVPTTKADLQTIKEAHEALDSHFARIADVNTLLTNARTDGYVRGRAILLAGSRLELTDSKVDDQKFS